MSVIAKALMTATSQLRPATTAFVVEDDIIYAVDVTNSSFPTLTSSLAINAGHKKAVYSHSDKRVYAMNDTQVTVIDVADTSSMSIIETETIESDRTNLDLALDDAENRLYILNNERLHRYGVTSLGIQSQTSEPFNVGEENDIALGSLCLDLTNRLAFCAVEDYDGVDVKFRLRIMAVGLSSGNLVRRASFSGADGTTNGYIGGALDVSRKYFFFNAQDNGYVIRYNPIDGLEGRSTTTISTNTTDFSANEGAYLRARDKNVISGEKFFSVSGDLLSIVSTASGSGKMVHDDYSLKSYGIVSGALKILDTKNPSSVSVLGTYSNADISTSSHCVLNNIGPAATNAYGIGS